jgi:hypothetical protein
MERKHVNNIYKHISSFKCLLKIWLGTCGRSVNTYKAIEEYLIEVYPIEVYPIEVHASQWQRFRSNIKITPMRWSRCFKRFAEPTISTVYLLPFYSAN